MLVLALDTTTREGSAALVSDARILVESSGDPSRSHAERLPRELLSLVARAGIALSDVDVFAVASGPGSFTGLRVGIATVQGLASASGRFVVPVSALEALALQACRDLPSGTLVGAWTDAKRHEVFSGLYRVADAGEAARARLVEVEGPAVGSPAATLARWAARGHVPDFWTGDGVWLYGPAAGGGDRGPDQAQPLAGTIGIVAARRAAEGGAVAPSDLHPLYVRRPDAELARDAAALDSAPGTRS